MVDRRRIVRTRICAPAVVIANGGSLVWKCFVRDITSLGARLEFQDAPALPTAFNLTFDGKTVRRCDLKWRNANEVGVSFQRSRKTRPNGSFSFPNDFSPLPSTALRSQQ